MKYKWSSYGGITGIPAQEVGEHLDGLRARHGKLTAQIVLADARRKKSPIHNAFEWNDGEAAEKYRLIQAMNIVRAVVVVLDEVPNSPPVRAFVSVKDERGSSYESIITTLKDAGLRDQVLERAKKEIVDWKVRYQNMVEFASIVSAIEETIAA